MSIVRSVRQHTTGAQGSSLVTAMSQGMNLGTIYNYNPEPIYVDLVKQGQNPYYIDASRLAVLDSNGWPNEDFIMGPTQSLPPDAALSQTYTMLVDGNPGTVAMRTANYWTLGAVVYNSGTDTATITLTSPASNVGNFFGPQLSFTGTKKTPVSAVGSGVRKIRLPRVGYESTPDQLVTNEFIAQAAPFKVLRFMKVMGAEHNVSFTNYAQYPKRANFGMFGSDPAGDPVGGNGIMSIEDIVDICNATGCSPWITLNGNADGTLGVLSQEYGFATYIEANLRADCFAVYEDGNEKWNFIYRWFAFAVNKVMKEIHGFWNEATYDRGERKLLSAVRAGNVVTCQMNVAHEMTAMQNLSCYIGANMGGAVTVIDATHFSFPNIGADATLSLTSAGGGITGISTLTFDAGAGEVTYPSQYLGERWFDRRRVQMSDNIRLAVGDSKMFTRHRPVYMTQIAGAGTLYRFTDGKATLAALGTTFVAKFSAVGGGCYVDSTTSTSYRPTIDFTLPLTKADWVAAYQDSTTIGFANNAFNLDLFKSFALVEGIKLYCYELGIDTKMYSYGQPTTYFAANAATLRDATLDPQWTTIETNWITQQAQYGVDVGIQFNMEMVGATGYGAGVGYWAMTTGTLSVSAKEQAFKNFASNPPSYDRNIIPGVVDGRALVGQYGVLTALAYPTMHAIGGLSSTRLTYLLNSSTGTISSLTIDYKTLVAVAHTITLEKNGVTIGTISVPSVGVGLTGTTLPISVTLTPGAQNCIQLLRDNDNLDFEVRALHFT